MRKVFTLLTVLLWLPMLAVAGEPDPTVWDGKTVSTKWYDDNTEAAAFKISTAADLAGLSQLVAQGTSFDNKTIELQNDIYLNQGLLDKNKNLNEGVWNEWVPIGGVYSYYGLRFKGTFDGKNHIISGVYVSKNKCTVENAEKSLMAFGLFGIIEGGEVKNLGVKDSYIKGFPYTDNYNGLGGVVGTVMGGGTVCKCFFDGMVLPGDENSGKPRYTGGVVGILYGGTVTSCYNMGTVGDVTIQNIGGVVGTLDGTSSTIKHENAISYCYNVGLVKGRTAGGVCSSLQGSYVKSTMKYCYNLGQLEGGDDSGNGLKSLCDVHNGSTVKESYALKGILDGQQGPNFVVSPKLDIDEMVSIMNKNLTSEQGWTGNVSYLEGVLKLPVLNDFSEEVTVTYKVLTDESIKDGVKINFIEETLEYNADEYEVNIDQSFGSKYKVKTGTTIKPKDQYYVRSKKSFSSIYELNVPARPEYKGKLKAVEVTSTSVTLEFETENKDLPYQYAYFDSDRAEYIWQDSPEFKDLMPGMTYDFQCGIKATEENFSNIDRSGSRDIQITTKSEYTITLTQVEGGVISSSKEKAAEGETITLTATANEGYTFKGWQSEDVEIDNDDNSFIMPAKNVTITAVFEKIPEPTPDPEEPVIPDLPNYYNIYVEDCEGVTVELTKAVVREGNSTSFTIEIAEGYNAEGMEVTVKRSLFGYSEIVTPDEDGRYTISNIWTDIYITVKGVEEENPTGIKDIDGIKVYTKDGSAYVETPQPEEVTIVSMNGIVVKREIQEGVKRYDLPRGIYIINVGSHLYKVRI